MQINQMSKKKNSLPFKMMEIMNKKALTSLLSCFSSNVRPRFMESKDLPLRGPSLFVEYMLMFLIISMSLPVF